eukprot:4107377-Prorocentrum_lima.AAC.1
MQACVIQELFAQFSRLDATKQPDAKCPPGHKIHKQEKHHTQLYAALWVTKERHINKLGEDACLA